MEFEERRALLDTRKKDCSDEERHLVDSRKQDTIQTVPVSGRLTTRPGRHMNRILLIVGCFATGFAAGFQMSTSFLIHPVTAACTPPWSSSATVYGVSALAVGWALSGLLSLLLRKAGLRVFGLISLLTCTASFLLAGLSVSTCVQNGAASQVGYIGSFCMFGFGADLALRTMGEMLVPWLPHRPGLAGGLFGMGISLGSIGFSLTELGFTQLFDEGKLDAATFLFLLGLIVLFLMVPWIPFMSYPSGKDAQTDLSPLLDTVKTELGKLRQLLRTRQMLFLSFGYFANFFTGMAVVSSLSKILSSLWKDSNPPLMVLSVISLSCYTVGRFLSLALGDTIGLKRIWSVALLSQTVVLAILPWLIEGTHLWTQFAAIVAVSAYMFVYPAVKATQLGFTYVTVGNENGSIACGLLSIVSGPAGLIGPIAIEQTLVAFGTYKPFFLGTAVLTLLAALCMFFVHPLDVHCSSTRTEISP